jgi:hypothetical protein
MGYISSGCDVIQRSKHSSIFSVLRSVILIATVAFGLGYFAFRPFGGERNVSVHTRDAGASLGSDQAFGEDIFAAGPSAGTAVYPYSVIPGGARSSKELGAALRIDDVAREHYADFNVAAARIIRVAADRKAYVSYRKGDKIFWTRKQVKLHAGETLLSDGEHLARTRCGNRVSAVPRSPVSPDEPEETAGDVPVGPRVPVTASDANLAWPVWTESPDAGIVLTAVNLSALPMPGGMGGGEFYASSGMPGPGCCFVTAPISGTHTTPSNGGGGPPESGSQPAPPPSSGPSGPGTGPSGSWPPNIPGSGGPGPTGPGSEGPGTVPVAAPEPSSLLLLGVGLAGVTLLLKLGFLKLSSGS